MTGGWREEARTLHIAERREFGKHRHAVVECAGCDQPWPCDAARALDALDRIDAALDAAEPEDVFDQKNHYLIGCADGRRNAIREVRRAVEETPCR